MFLLLKDVAQLGNIHEGYYIAALTKGSNGTCLAFSLLQAQARACPPAPDGGQRKGYVKTPPSLARVGSGSAPA